MVFTTFEFIKNNNLYIHLFLFIDMLLFSGCFSYHVKGFVCFFFFLKLFIVIFFFFSFLFFFVF